MQWIMHPLFNQTMRRIPTHQVGFRHHHFDDRVDMIPLHAVGIEMALAELVHL